MPNNSMTPTPDQPAVWLEPEDTPPEMLDVQDMDRHMARLWKLDLHGPGGARFRVHLSEEDLRLAGEGYVAVDILRTKALQSIREQREKTLCELAELDADLLDTPPPGEGDGGRGADAGGGDG